MTATDSVDPRRPLVRRLAQLGREQSLAKGSTLFHQGDEAVAIYCLTEGRIRLDRHLEDGRVATVAVVRGPGLLAEASLFSDHYRCSAAAETECVLWRVGKSIVAARLETDPAFALDLIRLLASEVRELRTRLELRNVRPASERLLRYLEIHAGHRGAHDDRPLAALADELGLSPEALYRIVARLEREGRLAREGRRLVVVSPP